MKNFKIYDRKIYKVKFCVKKYNGLVSPVRVGYGKMEYVDLTEKEEIYVKKTLNPNVVKELKTGEKIPVIYEKSKKNVLGITCERKVSGSLSAPCFVLIRTFYFNDKQLNSNFRSNILVDALAEYAAKDYETFNYELNCVMNNANKDKSYYLNRGVIPVSSPWREKVNAIRQKLKSMGEEIKTKKQENNEKKELVKNMKEQRRK